MTIIKEMEARIEDAEEEESSAAGTKRTLSTRPRLEKVPVMVRVLASKS